MLLYDHNRLFWILLIFALVFFILSVVALLNYKQEAGQLSKSSVLMLSALWFLSFILLFLICYSSLLSHCHCQLLIFLIYLLSLIFLTMWCMQINNLTDANISIIIILITSIAIIFFTKPQYYPLGLIFVLIWLYIFFYMNQ